MASENTCSTAVLNSRVYANDFDRFVELLQCKH